MDGHAGMFGEELSTYKWETIRGSILLSRGTFVRQGCLYIALLVLLPYSSQFYHLSILNIPRMLASVISALGLLATSVFATPVALVEERAPSTFRISTLKVVQNNKNLNQQTQVTFSFTIQDLTAGPVNFCQYT